MAKAGVTGQAICCFGIENYKMRLLSWTDSCFVGKWTWSFIRLSRQIEVLVSALTVNTKEQFLSALKVYQVCTSSLAYAQGNGRGVSQKWIEAKRVQNTFAFAILQKVQMELSRLSWWWMKEQGKIHPQSNYTLHEKWKSFITTKLRCSPHLILRVYKLKWRYSRDASFDTFMYFCSLVFRVITHFLFT